jgi:hypothetical protein
MSTIHDAPRLARRAYAYALLEGNAGVDRTILEQLLGGADHARELLEELVRQQHLRSMDAGTRLRAGRPLPRDFPTET